MAGELIFGDQEGLRISLVWLPAPEGSVPGPVQETWGSLALSIGEKIIWGDDAPVDEQVEWNWIDFLEFMIAAWPYLSYEETYPISFPIEGDPYEEDPPHPGHLRVKVEQSWDTIPEDQSIDEDEALRDFEVVHDLAEGFWGAWVPSVTLLRQGKEMWVGTDDEEWRLPFIKVMTTLEQFADAIAQRVEKLTDGRSRSAVERWRRHHVIEAKQRLRIAAGMTESRVTALWPASEMAREMANDNVTDTKFDASELAVAARMMDGVMADGDVAMLLRYIAETPHVKTPALDALAARCDKELTKLGSVEPYVAGNSIAQWLRKELSYAEDAVLDPELMLSNWGVRLMDIELSGRRVDAVAAWGPGHGPVILVNKLGKRVSRPAGRRSSLAHELGHLLMDRRRRLPAAEVLGGRVNHAIEARANGFAAELILPVAVVRTTFIQRFGDRPDDMPPSDLEDYMRSLSERYGASFEVVSWRIGHAGVLGRQHGHLLNKYQKSINDRID
ncbi:MAG: ImmA/IrrE family metallo-endopeptidase [Alphaproteobacteria bacterium]